MYTAPYWQGLVLFDKMKLELPVLIDLLRNKHITQTGDSLSLTIEGLKLQQSIQNPDVGKEYILVHASSITRVTVDEVSNEEVKFSSEGISDTIWKQYCGFIDPNQVIL